MEDNSESQQHRFSIVSASSEAPPKKLELTQSSRDLGLFNEDGFSDEPLLKNCHSSSELQGDSPNTIPVRQATPRLFRRNPQRSTPSLAATELHGRVPPDSSLGVAQPKSSANVANIHPPRDFLRQPQNEMQGLGGGSLAGTSDASQRVVPETQHSVPQSSAGSGVNPPPSDGPPQHVEPKNEGSESYFSSGLTGANMPHPGALPGRIPFEIESRSYQRFYPEVQRLQSRSFADGIEGNPRHSRALDQQFQRLQSHLFAGGIGGNLPPSDGSSHQVPFAAVPHSDILSPEIQRAALKLGAALLSFFITALWLARDRKNENDKQLISEELYRIGMGLAAGGGMIGLITWHFLETGWKNVSKYMIFILLGLLLFIISGFISFHVFGYSGTLQKSLILGFLFFLCVVAILIPPLDDKLKFSARFRG